MAEQNRSGGYTQVLYSPTGQKLALASNQALTKAFIPLPGGATAIYDNTGLSFYRHRDWLGSSRLTSSPSRSVLSALAYAPFGELQNTASDVSIPTATFDPSWIIWNYTAGNYPGSADDDIYSSDWMFYTNVWLAANNTATISATTGVKEAYCNKQADMARASAILPGLGDVIYNHHNVDVAQKLTSGILQSFFGFGTAAGQAMSAASKSDAALTNIRSTTGVPKTLAKRAFFWAGVVQNAYQVTKALAISKNQYQACMASY
jgi:hypothetical protein